MWFSFSLAMIKICHESNSKPKIIKQSDNGSEFVGDFSEGTKIMIREGTISLWAN